MAKKERLTIILMTYLSLFGLGLVDNLRGALFPEILNLFKVSSSSGSLFFICASLFSIIGGLLTNKLCSRHSAFSVWRLGVLFMALGGAGIYASASFPWLLFSASVLGFGFGTLAVTTNLLITSVTSSATAKRVLSGLHSMYGISSFLAPLLVMLFARQGLNWGYLFLGASLLILVLFGFSLKMSFNVLTKESSPLSSMPPPSRGLNRHKVTFVFVIASYVALEMLLCSRLTSYLTGHLHWPIDRASQYLTYFFIALLSGRVLFSFFHPPISTRQTLIISLMGTSAMGFLGLRLNPVFLSLAGFFMAPFYPLAMGLLAETFPKDVTRMMSITIVLQSLFVIIMNLLAGFITDHMGVAMSLNLMFIFAGMGWIGLLGLGRKGQEGTVNTPMATEPLTH